MKKCRIVFILLSLFRLLQRFKKWHHHWGQIKYLSQLSLILIILYSGLFRASTSWSVTKLPLPAKQDSVPFVLKPWTSTGFVSKLQSISC